MTAVAFIGLGRMGYGMARNLIKHGHAVTVFDRVQSIADAFRDATASIAKSPSEAACQAETVITMLPRPSDVRDAVLGPEGAATSLRKGGLIIDMSTGSPAESRRLGEDLEKLGLSLIDAPVGRTPMDAAAGTLLILAGGKAEDVERARPLLLCIGNEIIHAGPLGSGGTLKLVNNYMTVIGNAVAAETLAFGKRAGLDRDVLMRVLQSTVAGKGAINVIYPRKVLSGDVTPMFSTRLAHKDLVLALELANEVGVPLSLGGVAREMLSLAGARGRWDQDMTALLLVLEEISDGSTAGTPANRGE
jgi:4-hydroxybutyrate dehydrogenase/sulfolactaldehyde 3-reductase